MQISQTQVEQLTKTLYLVGGWIVGVLTTVAGSWLASKIGIYHDNRKSHLDDIKTKVLAPLRDGLQAHYQSLVTHRTPVVTMAWGSLELRGDAPVTEPVERRGPYLSKANPAILVENSMDRVLLEDSRQSHYKDLASAWEKFTDSWSKYCEECFVWLSRISERIREASGLPELRETQRYGEPYVSHLQLGCYVYHRLFGIPTNVLRVEQRDALFCITGIAGESAMGTRGQVDALIELLNTLLRDEGAAAEALRTRAEGLGSDLTALLNKLALALVSKRLPGSCQLVPFF